MVKKTVFVTAVFALCGILLTSLDDCENFHLEQYELAEEAETGEASAQADSGSGAPGQSTDAARTASASGQSAAARQQPEQTAEAQASRTGSGAQQSPQTGRQQGSAAQQQGSGQQASQTGVQQSAQAGSAGTQAGAAAGAAAGTVSAGSTGISSISGKNWKLAELRKGGVVTVINRDKLDAEGFGDLFTINFGERVSGKAAPNRFTAAYQSGANNTLSIQQPASTLMAFIYDPERIHEKDYFMYLSGIKSWKLNQGKLELYSSDSEGKETVLVYIN